MRVLITGVKSGLGRFLHEEMGGPGLSRETTPEEFEFLRKSNFDLIVHCAAKVSRQIDSNSLLPYLEDNLWLTQRLASIPHQKFIYLSSIDVYSKSSNPHQEGEVIDVLKLQDFYALTKLMSESIVRQKSPNFLILRGAALLGKYSRKNSLIRILEEEDCTLSLSGDSVFNYVRHEDVLAFIRSAFSLGLTGTYNMASSSPLCLEEISEMFHRKVRFGSYRYETGKIDNHKIASICPAFGRTSREVVEQFAEEYSSWKKALVR